MRTLNVLVWGEQFSNIIKELSEKGYLNIVVEFSHDKKPGCYCESDLIFDALSIVKYTYDIPFDMYENIQTRYFDLFFANIARVDSYTGRHTEFPEAVYRFRKMVCFLFDLLICTKPEICIFPGLPHQVVDTLCFFVAKEIGIKAFILVTPPYTNTHFFSLTSPEQYGIFHCKKLLRDIKPYSIDTFLYKHKAGLSINQSSNKMYKDRLSMIMSWKPSKAYNLFLYNEYKTIQSCLFRQYESVENFVYFPLHFQPESATIGQAPLLYDDQVTCIEYLSQILPDNFVIFVKENPGQFFYWRNKIFYTRLLSIPSVRLVPKNIDSVALIKQSRIVATVTGTAGWEALKFGKPVIYFGYALYREIPGAFEFSPSLNIFDVLNFKIDKDKIEMAIGHLIATLYEGSLDIDGLPVDNEDENKKNVSMSLENIITDFSNTEPNYFNNLEFIITGLAIKTKRHSIGLSPDISDIFKLSKTLKSHSMPFWTRKILKIFDILEAICTTIRFQIINHSFKKE
jgi:hypothetical protein